MGRWIYDLQPSSAQNHLVEDEKSPKYHYSLHLNLLQVSNEEHHTALLDLRRRIPKAVVKEKRCDHYSLHECVQSLDPGDPLRIRQNEKYFRCLVRLLSSSVRYRTQKCTAPIMEKRGDFARAAGGIAVYRSRHTINGAHTVR